MASTAFESPAGKPPISLHPAFPAVVALWFAALLGLGSLVLPLILLERVIDVSGLATYIPAAAPPLGFTARGAIAGVAAVLGAFAGIAIARRVAAAHAPNASVRRGGFGAREPLDVHDALGVEGIAPAAPARPRPLAIEQDERPSDFLGFVPLPGEDLYSEPAVFDPAIPADDLLELSELAAAEPVLEDIERDDEIVPLAQDAPMSEEPPVQFPSKEEAERRRTDRRSTYPGKGPGGIDRRLFLRRVEDDPLPFVAPSLTRRIPDNENSAPEPVAVESAKPAAPASADWQTAPLDQLGMLQLLERLGASLEKRRERTALAPQASVAPAPVAAPDAFDAAPAEDAAEAMAAYFCKAPAPVATADARRERFSQPDFSFPDFDAPDQAEEDEPAGEFASLLGRSNPFQAPREDHAAAARPFDAPAKAPALVPRPAPEEADEALRRALATLQRMSGSN